ncbi:hypothetical protein [Mesorhizobium sp. Z1-4]|uniref:hypothetical protein n=1 Tax=Mesorhizobium sp. Z1-4 TaxID=2448478 RepID=UPI000FD80B7A|nr:hypothetical protein [Mesorhizobium sp. Z1-4]
MSDNTEKAIEQDNVRRLSAAILEAKSARADRDDVVHEIRDLQRARLDVLKQELQDVIEDVPADDETFDFAISSGVQPRFWIDAVAYVAIARDRRTYRFLRDTRAGRVVLAEAEDAAPVADAVTRYVAERIVERKRQLEEPEERTAARPSPLASGQADAAASDEAAKRSRAGEALSGLALIIIGVLIGGATTLALLRDRVPEITSVLGLN